MKKLISIILVFLFAAVLPITAFAENDIKRKAEKQSFYS